MLSIIGIFAFDYVYRFPPQGLILVVFSLAVLATQILEASHEWSTYRPQKKATRSVIFLSLVCTAYLGVGLTRDQWTARPRQIDRITEWRMVRDLSQFQGTSVEVIASVENNADATETCNLKFQLDDILKAAHWYEPDFGVCEATPSDYGWAYTIKFDRRSQDAMVALQGFLASQNWGAEYAVSTTDGKPIPLYPFPVAGRNSVDVLIDVYDQVH